MGYDHEPFPTEFTASSRTGSVVVTTTEQGLPLGIEVDRDRLRGDLGPLAREIVLLCRQAASRAGMERREHLRAAGLAPEHLALTRLPTAEEVARQEYADEQDYEDEPDSWLRPV
ncbi:hypothetical protein IU501_12530 [Nocardia otitidiscaviarum]|uniref:hypothetical protein n=1 Tax=Nocardia otitidiscaviarum TaxID=1823 RepID=UPI0004A76AF2|nr:hypothetical protein [Nocardia otitidiscaviarum]MBF6133824.1 hypothetical protein [Nocardia otitidiscaviarum]MBF6235794.1 hypothetical protein [Nocardia otitidiscaviarum]MBF6487852.1 hypothetical protein [Nocardia otitidiscaviarum]